MSQSMRLISKTTLLQFLLFSLWWILSWEALGAEFQTSEVRQELRHCHLIESDHRGHQQYIAHSPSNEICNFSAELSYNPILCETKKRITQINFHAEFFPRKFYLQVKSGNSPPAIDFSSSSIP